MNNNQVRGGQENIIPVAGSLFSAIRDLGYENTAAIADLVDNSIDAGANNVRITVSDDMSKIFIADDGSGMSCDMLNTAIKLGGKKTHDNSSDLGKYGMGLVTASLSLGRTLRVITKKDGEYNTAVLDYDYILSTDKFIADFHYSTNTEKEAFEFRTHNANSGTIIIIDNCDSIQYTKAKDLIAALESNLGQVFRAFLKKGKHIFINDSEILSIDPLFSELAGVEKLVDTDVEIRSGGTNKGTIHVLAVQIPDQGVKRNKVLRLNIAGQGFYMLRNNREIAPALEFEEIFKKHNDFNLLRIEISFSSELDSLMGVNIKKHDVTPSKEIINALNEVLEEPIKRLRNKMKIKQKKTEITNPFLNEPTISSVDTESKAEHIIDTAISTDTPTVIDLEPIITEYEYQFSSYAGNETDPLFKVSVADNRVVIRYNLCNGYYKTNIINAADSQQAKNILDTLLESSLKAYLKTSGAASLSIFANELAQKI